MGTYLAKIPQPADLPPNVTPRSGEMSWIIHNAAACAMSPVEVHRLWTRFKQLGSTNDGTIIVKGAKISDYFAVKILHYLQNTKGEVMFKTFLCAALWWSRCDLEDKLGVVFYLMNEHYPINLSKWKEVLAKIHPEWDEYKVDDVANTVVSSIDYNRDGQVDLNEFKTWHMAHLEQTARLLDFLLLPPEVKVQDDQLPISRIVAEQDIINKLQAEIVKSLSPRDSLAAASGAAGGGPGMSSLGQSLVRGDPVGDHVLRAAAERLVGRDWMMLSNQLNFTVADIDAIASLYAPGQELQKILTILKTWRDRERGFATIEAFEQALVRSGMRDVVADLRTVVA